MNLVIVESPTKARTLSRFLGNEYQIEASMGHIRDLPKSVLGVDIAKNFEPEYVQVVGKEKAIKNLKTKAKAADTIILATDPDREGEAIAWHVAQILGAISRFKRIVFHEITREAIEDALRNPRDIDMHLVDAQMARRVLDRLVGYKLSPLLWQKVRRGLSAGRVQSVAVRLIVEREREIERFEKKKYWTIVASLMRLSRQPHTANDAVPRHPDQAKRVEGSHTSKSVEGDSSTSLRSARNDNGVMFELIEINGQKIEEKETIAFYDGDYTYTKTSIDTKERADGIVAVLQGKPFIVADILQKEMRRSPYPPFTTSTLTQEASRRFGFSSKRTMQIAQALYEEGFITYHRTDSVNMAKQAIFAIRSFIERTYGKKYVSEHPRIFKTKQKLAQEAHEAIRPTYMADLRTQSAKIKKEMGNDAVRLYELIWKRTLASQMAEAILESTMVLADCNEYRFKAAGSVIVFDGFLKLYPQALIEQKLLMYLQGETLKAEKIEAVEHETVPPPRYNEASLIATLEEKGIGRPSTYAPIISTIQERQYVEKEEGKFVPTPVGVAVNDFLVANFTEVVDIPFTAQMEDGLDEIANDGKPWQPMISDFYKPFEKKLESVEGAARVKIAVEKTDEKCPRDGSLLVIRVGRFGKFLACSKFPQCKFTKSFEEDTGIVCPLDGGRVILKKSRHGRKFYGCSNYPACKFAAWRLEDIKKN